MRYFFIALGGALGTVSRFLMGGLVLFPTDTVFPLNTILINTAGSFILAFIMSLSKSVLNIPPEIKSGITTGFLGAFTTFSAFCGEIYFLFTTGEILTGTAYAACSAILGVLCAFTGIYFATHILTGLTLNSAAKERPKA